MDLGSLMEQAQQMLAGAQEAAAEVIEGSSGGGMVKIEVDGGFNFHSVSIDPSVVDPNDVEMLNDLVLAALRDASTQLQENQTCLLYTSPSPRDKRQSRMPSSA